MNAVRPWLFIGKLAETLRPELLREHQIGAMLQLCENVPQEGIVHRFLDVDDRAPLSPELIAAGVTFVREQKAAGRTVLIACGRGVSRSATFAVAALKEEEGLGLLDALRVVTAARREARPHPILWQSLGAYYNEPVVLTEMLKVCRPPGWT